jgi:hypothetical protein
MKLHEPAPGFEAVLLQKRSFRLSWSPSRSDPLIRSGDVRPRDPIAMGVTEAPSRFQWV